VTWTGEPRESWRPDLLHWQTGTSCCTPSCSRQNYSSVIRFESSMQATDGAVSLLAPEWKARRDSARPNILPLALRVPGRDVIVAFGLTSQMLHSGRSTGCRAMHMDPGRILEHCEVEVEAGTECHLSIASCLCSRLATGQLRLSNRWHT
jgi:hypothetical protein